MTVSRSILEELERRGIRPIAGGAGGGGATPPAGDPPAPPAGDPPAPPAPADEWTPPTREEYEAAIKERDDAKAAAARADSARRAKERAAAEASGNFEELHKQGEAKLEKVTGLIRTNTIGSGVGAVAERLGFRTPSIAAKLINTADLNVTVDLDSDELPKLDSAADSIIETRLKALAEQEPGLLREGPGRMLPGAGGQAPAGGSGNAAMNQAIRSAAGR